MVWHEVGHYHDYENLLKKYGADFDREKVYEDRRKHLAAGTVQPEELFADQFAVRMCGKSRVINALDWVINRRLIKNDEYADAAIMELRQRKKAVQRL